MCIILPKVNEIQQIKYEKYETLSIHAFSKNVLFVHERACQIYKGKLLIG